MSAHIRHRAQVVTQPYRTAASGAQHGVAMLGGITLVLCTAGSDCSARRSEKENGVDPSRPVDLVTVTLLGRHLADALAPEARG
jgi:hypothetical protein